MADTGHKVWKQKVITPSGEEGLACIGTDLEELEEEFLTVKVSNRYYVVPVSWEEPSNE